MTPGAGGRAGRADVGGESIILSRIRRDALRSPGRSIALFALLALAQAHPSLCSASDLLCYRIEGSFSPGTRGNRLVIALEDSIACRDLRLDLTYDPSALRPTGARVCGPMSVATILGRQRGASGRFHILYTNTARGHEGGLPSAIGGDVAVIELEIPPEVPSGTLTEVVCIADLGWPEDRGKGGATLVWTLPINSAVGLSGRSAMGLPETFAAYPAWPNPFNKSVAIRYDLPRPERVTVRLFDLAGRMTAEPFKQSMPAGRHTFVWPTDGRDGRSPRQGVYFYELRAGEFRATGRLTCFR